jgi:hypothetical protein
MRSRIILTAVFSILAIATLAFGDESGGTNTVQLLKDALPQMVFIAVLLINLCTALMDSDRNFMASLIATFILVAITYWGGFYKPLLDFLATKL